MPRALIIGGTGQIGRAAAERLSDEGWAVTLASRALPPCCLSWRHVVMDRDDAVALRKEAAGVDLLLDCVAYDLRHAEQLADVAKDVGRLAVISSASVYCDDEGRTLDEAPQCGFPVFPNPITQGQRTVAPGSGTYSERKSAIEQHLLEKAVCPLTILRPCAIHGPYSRHAREWWFVMRLRDGRRQIPLAYGGRSQFQTTSTAAIASAIQFALHSGGSQVMNVTDADAPSVAQIGRTIMQAMGRSAELMGLPDAAYGTLLGATPWSVPRPMVLASSVPQQQTYAETAPPAIAWLISATQKRNWREVLPQMAAYAPECFDYATDDEALRQPGAATLPD